MKELKIGLIGCGGMGNGHANAIAAREDARIVATCDIIEERAQAYAARFGAEQVFTSHEALLAQADVDAVVVATPNSTHAEIVVDAARRGKHIFCEKPMALTVADCDAMIAAARKAGVKLMIGQVLRYLPIQAKVKELVDSGTLGPVMSVEIARVSGPLRADWRSKKEFAGGILFEVHVHELDWMAHVIGEPVSVSAFVNKMAERGYDYEDNVQALYRFETGAIGYIHASFASAAHRYDGKWICENGALIFDQNRMLLRQMMFGRKRAKIYDLRKAPYAGVRVEIEQFVRSVLDDTPVIIPGEDGRRAVGMAQGAYLSAESGRAVALPLK